jgi:2-polyprenyl-3-methyl-5-hydroxy-6-metoxy-1,4-benzoquinol methylase
VIRDSSDTSWKKWGAKNPYYGVLTDEKFRRENLSDGAKAEFFETGRIHVERILSITQRFFGTTDLRRSALDFGCGVGRIVIPLAAVFEHVTGVDISPGMLETAQHDCALRGIRNVEFASSDDGLTHVQRKFDFVHSYLVLQHIPVRRGERIITQLAQRLNDDGVLALHMPFSRNESVIRKFSHLLRKNFSPLSVLVNIAKRRQWNEPFIQMNMYDMNRILVLLSQNGIKDVFCEVVDAGGFVSAFIFARRSAYVEANVQGKHLWAIGLDKAAGQK